MVAACRGPGVPLLVHENWRWQTPIRQLKRSPRRGRSAGRSVRAASTSSRASRSSRTSRSCAELEQFILTDIGATSSTWPGSSSARPSACMPDPRVHRDIQGEDVATVDAGDAGGPPTVAATWPTRATPWSTTGSRRPSSSSRASAGSVELRPGLLDPHDDRRRHASPGATRRRATPGPTRPTTSSTPASSPATPTCWPRCAARRAETDGEDNLRTLRLGDGRLRIGGVGRGGAARARPRARSPRRARPPAKAILFGEHAVNRGGAALATAVGMRVRCSVRACSDEPRTCSGPASAAPSSPATTSTLRRRVRAGRAPSDEPAVVAQLAADFSSPRRERARRARPPASG